MSKPLSAITESRFVNTLSVIAPENSLDTKIIVLLGDIPIKAL